MILRGGKMPARAHLGPMQADKSRWKKKADIESVPLRNLETAWRSWAPEGSMPSRDLFDPMHFPEVLPWMILAELVDKPNEARPYDMYFRYIGTEFARYFNAQSVTRMLLSEVGPPYIERWFAVADAVKKAKAPRYFKGAPFGTGYEYIALEMLALPFTRPEATPGSTEVGFILCTFARMEELLL